MLDQNEFSPGLSKHPNQLSILSFTLPSKGSNKEAFFLPTYIGHPRKIVGNEPTVNPIEAAFEITLFLWSFGEAKRQILEAFTSCPEQAS